MSTGLCADCGAIYLRQAFTRGQRALRCPDCKAKRHAQQKLESDRRRNERRRLNESWDISAEEIELRYQAALKEARKQPTELVEPARSFSWLYREPRS